MLQIPIRRQQATPSRLGESWLRRPGTSRAHIHRRHFLHVLLYLLLLNPGTAGTTYQHNPASTPPLATASRLEEEDTNGHCHL